jgi:regulator of protease activity HflC (stomatin/prohibitin superfamily)
MSDWRKVRAEWLVRHAAEEGIVKVVAQTTADDFVAANVDRDAARRAIQAELDNMEAGITVTQVLLSQPTPPLAVRDAFQAVSQAEAEQADQIEQARQEATKILSSTAGTAYPMLVDAIERYEQARAEDNADAVVAADQRIAELLRSDQVSGNVKPPIEEAINYRTAAKESVRGEVDRFEKLLPKYRDNPRIIRNRLWQDVLQKLYASNDNERFYLPSHVTELWLDVNRDPDIRRRREQQRYQAEQQQAE